MKIISLRTGYATDHSESDYQYVTRMQREGKSRRFTKGKTEKRLHINEEELAVLLLGASVLQDLERMGGVLVERKVLGELVGKLVRELAEDSLVGIESEARGFVGQVQLSLDGYDAESHEAHRMLGNFEKTLSAMRLLKEMDIAFGVNILVTRGSDFPRTARLAIERGSRQINALRPKPAANDIGWFQQYSPLPGEFIELRRELDRLTLEYPEVCFTVDSALVFLMGNLTSDELQAHAIYGCDAGVRSIAVRANGNVYPCSQFSDNEFCAGNVTEAGLGSIWHEAAVLWRFREMTPKLKGRCSICSVRDYCKGCRRIAHFMTGNFYAEDPGCLQVVGEQAAIEGQTR